MKLNTLAATTSNKDGNPKDSTKFEIPTFSTSLVVLSILALPLLLIIAVFSIMKLRKRGNHKLQIESITTISNNRLENN